MAAAHLVVRVQLRNVLDRTAPRYFASCGGRQKICSHRTAVSAHLRYVAIGKHALGRYFARECSLTIGRVREPAT